MFVLRTFGGSQANTEVKRLGKNKGMHIDNRAGNLGIIHVENSEP